MNRFIKFTMSDGPHFTLPEAIAQRILDSAQQMIKVTDQNGKWTGQTINKAHIISTDRDRDAERDFNLQNVRQLPEPEKTITPEQEKRIGEIRKQISDRFSVRGKSTSV